MSALLMTELNCAIDVSMLLIAMELKTRNCCFVCSMNNGQFFFVACACYLVWCGC